MNPAQLAHELIDLGAKMPPALECDVTVGGRVVVGVTYSLNGGPVLLSVDAPDDEPLDSDQLLALHGLLVHALHDQGIAGRLVPTLRGKGRTRHGTGLMHALDAVEAEMEHRGMAVPE